MDFERKGILNDDVNEIIEEMSEAMQTDTRRIVPQIIGWLQGS